MDTVEDESMPDEYELRANVTTEDEPEAPGAIERANGCVLHLGSTECES